uniref:Glutaredoxin-C3 isoform X4 n=1 Tax=Rhizophora mucronata TaxID=61149 RepID=A0A2P2IMT9_RHIMU
MEPKHQIQLLPSYRTLSTLTRSSSSPNPTARIAGVPRKYSVN